MNGFVWTVQLVLAAIFLVSGTLKLLALTPLVKALQNRTNGSIPVLPMQGKLIGLLEVALAFGVMMPDVFSGAGLVPEYIVVRLSAAGLALLAIAAGVDLHRRNHTAAPMVTVFLLAVLVIVGRWPGY